jgi:hypothetical protein
MMHISSFKGGFCVQDVICFKNIKHLQKTMKILFLFRGGSLGERIFYIITVITAVGEAMGEKRHYNTYYVQIAWE